MYRSEKESLEFLCHAAEEVMKLQDLITEEQQKFMKTVPPDSLDAMLENSFKSFKVKVFAQQKKYQYFRKSSNVSRESLLNNLVNDLELIIQQLLFM